MSQKYVSVWLGKGQATYEELEEIIREKFDEEVDDFVDTEFMLAFGIKHIDPDYTELSIHKGEIEVLPKGTSWATQFEKEAAEDARTKGLAFSDFSFLIYDFKYDGKVDKVKVGNLTVTFLGTYAYSTAG